MQELLMALEVAPGSPFQLGLETLLHAAFLGIDLNPLGTRLIAHLAEFPEDAIRYMDLSYVLQIGGHEVMAATLQAEALRLERHYKLPTANVKPRIRLLAMMAPGDFMANTPLEFLVSKSDIALETLYVLPGERLPSTLPEHDVLFMAVGESAATRALLADLSEVAGGWGTPLLNHPLYSLCLARDTVSLILHEESRIHMPLTAHVFHRDLAFIAAGEAAKDFLADATWPLIVRPLDSHAGKGLAKIDTLQDLDDYLVAHEATPEFYLSSFVDYRSPDGMFRKYRIVLIQGRPFLCHMAISSHWMIHYLNAEMTEKADRRAEEARTMENFDVDFAVRHQEAFAELHQAFPLDYFGIDCAETADGKLLVFEVDTGMIVHAMDPEDMFPYKHVAMKKVFDAFQNMVRTAAGRGHD